MLVVTAAGARHSRAKSVYSLFSRLSLKTNNVSKVNVQKSPVSAPKCISTVAKSLFFFFFLNWKTMICILLVLMSCCCASLDMKARNPDGSCFPCDANSSRKVTTSAGCRLFPENTLKNTESAGAYLEPGNWPGGYHAHSTMLRVLYLCSRKNQFNLAFLTSKKYFDGPKWASTSNVLYVL